MKRLQPALVLLLALLPSAALACLWDYDTLLAERSRFPSVLELITGKFLRHSSEFYEWRIKDRLKKLESEPENLAYLDDLAVTYDKLGKQDLAVELMERKEKIKPGLYETAANHGTFLAHAGRLKESLPFLKRAIEINPDAHFGREKYQIQLYEYAIANPPDISFGQYLQQQSRVELTGEERQRAIKGVLGIFRFGNQDNPKVLRVLASLLLPDHGENPEEDAKALAARALLKASYLVKDKDESSKLRGMAESALSRQTSPNSLTVLEPEFRRELDDAERWYDELRASELVWIDSGVDVDAEFAKLYQKEPRALTSRSEFNLDHRQSQTISFFGIVLIALTVLSLFAVIAIGAVYGFVRGLQWLSRPAPTIPPKVQK